MFTLQTGSTALVDVTGVTFRRESAAGLSAAAREAGFAADEGPAAVGRTSYLADPLPW